MSGQIDADVSLSESFLSSDPGGGGGEASETSRRRKKKKKKDTQPEGELMTWETPTTPRDDTMISKGSLALSDSSEEEVRPTSTEATARTEGEFVAAAVAASTAETLPSASPRASASSQKATRDGSQPTHPKASSTESPKVHRTSGKSASGSSSGCCFFCQPRLAPDGDSGVAEVRARLEA